MPTLDGAAVTLKLRAGAQSGTRHRVRGKGIATNKSTGDLIVTIDVDVPHHLTHEQRTAIEALAAATADSPRAALFQTTDG